ASAFGPSLVILIGAIVLFQESLNKDVLRAFQSRHLTNMGQVLAYGYQQRHPEWTHNPWTEYSPLMQQKFGRQLVSFTDAASINPQEIRDYVLWNLSLVPNGIQLALFNNYSGKYTPDFAVWHGSRAKAYVLSCVLLIVLAAGTYSLWRQREIWKRFLNHRRVWVLVTMATTLPSAFLAIITQRPRPSYIFTLALFVMVVTGFCMSAMLRNFRLHRSFNRISLVLALCVLVFIPAGSTIVTGERQLYEVYQRLYPYRQFFADTSNVFASDSSCSVVSNYLGEGSHLKSCYLPGDSQAGSAFQQFLQQNKVSLLYLAEQSQRRHDFAEWWTSPERNRWTIVAYDDKAKWIFLKKNG